MIALSVASTACQENPFAPFELKVPHQAYAIGTSFDVIAQDACTADETRDFDVKDRDLRAACTDDPVLDATVVSDSFTGGTARKLSRFALELTVTGHERADKLCVDVTGLGNDGTTITQKECAKVHIRTPDDIVLRPNCEVPGGSTRPFAVFPSAQFQIKTAVWGDGYELAGASVEPVIDAGPLTREGDRYTAPLQPGVFTVTETTFGNSIDVEVLDHRAVQWNFEALAVGIDPSDWKQRMRWTLDMDPIPCVMPSVAIQSLTPDTCTVPTDATSESDLFPIEWTGGVCRVEFELENTGKSTVVELSRWHRIFVTSEAFDGKIGGIEAADQLCQDAAGAAGLAETSWRAVLSDDNILAQDRITIEAPVFNVLGEIIMGDHDSFWLGHRQRRAANVTELGEILDNESVWTGTNSDGESGDNCENWTSRSLLKTGATGDTGAVDADWISDGGTLCFLEQRLYCISQ